MGMSQLPECRQEQGRLAKSPPPPNSLVPHAQLTPNQVNTFPDVHPASSWADLADGILLSEVLRDLDATYDAADIDRDPPPSMPQWLVNKNNLQALHRALLRFVNRECAEVGPLVSSADWRTLTEDPSEESLAKVRRGLPAIRAKSKAREVMLTRYLEQLVSVLVGVAFLGPNPSKYVGRLQQQFDQDTMVKIQGIIMEKQAEVKRAAEMDDSADQVIDERDAGLAFEEERVSLLSKLDNVKKQHADSITRLEHLQASYDTLRSEEAKLQRELEVLRKATQDGASGSQVVKMLEDKISDLEEVIANQEAQLEDDRIAKERLHHQVLTLTQKAERAQALEDEMSELRHQNNEYSRKANAAERLKQKLEQQQGLATEVENLRYEKAQLLRKEQDFERMQNRMLALERTNDEIRSSHAHAEETVFLLTNQKRMLEETNSGTNDELTRLNELRTRDEQFIQELQEQVGLASASGQSLEDELEGKPGAHALEMGRLRAENALLRRGAGPGDSGLQAELEEERRRSAERQAQLTEITERLAIAGDQISALVNDDAGEGLVTAPRTTTDEALSLLPAMVLNSELLRTRAFAQLRTEALQKEADLKAARLRVADLEAAVADRDREVLMARSELSAAAKEGADALEELRSTDGIVSESLRGELDVARARIKAQAEELETVRTQLIGAFVAKDGVRKELDELVGKAAAGEVSDEAMAQDTGKTSEKVEKLRERLVERNKVWDPFSRAFARVWGEGRAEPVVPEERPCTPFGSGADSASWAGDRSSWCGSEAGGVAGVDDSYYSCESVPRRPPSSVCSETSHVSGPRADADGRPGSDKMDWAPGKGRNLAGKGRKAPPRKKPRGLVSRMLGFGW